MNAETAITLNRYRKARKMAEALRSDGITADRLVGVMDDDAWWSAVASNAGTTYPSDISRALVVELLGESASVQS